MTDTLTAAEQAYHDWRAGRSVHGHSASQLEKQAFFAGYDAGESGPVFMMLTAWAARAKHRIAELEDLLQAEGFHYVSEEAS